MTDAARGRCGGSVAAPCLARAAAPVVLAAAAAGMIWVVGEACGMILAGGAADPGSGPLLALLALAAGGPAGRRPAVMPPAWVLDALAGVMLAVAAVSAARLAAGRLAAARPWRRGGTAVDTDVAHLLLAIAMSGMLTTSLRTMPAAVWEPVISVLTAWLVLRAARNARAHGLRSLPGADCSSCALHCSTCSSRSRRPARTAARWRAWGRRRHPLLALAFALALVGYSVLDIGRLSAGGPSRVTAGCRTAMGLIMAFMLIVVA